ncbi:hypothetical protein NS228_03000 [Methylobacterium indicum]|uniref:Porin n=1 Tax=Methylobacterium indicum TaxID=1775910 RepID=A0A8H8WZY3_9HYPH|nr:hypothetical protein [Methylobacterium indicum]KTS24931.1 hypothetical protein NS229_20985 [Methylobacterium indicum]KTS42248.1 hypothetical protein NS228_03000 [Methylobacterium indicum]KTS54093.1 hypothetical protein NS230_02785 [Methylobacterium indicum]BCM87469.1 hypothetical protein mvi_59300 [Methylobacterium indicum]
MTARSSAILALAVLVPAAVALPAVAGERGVRPARLCPQDAPPGVRLPDRPDCREAPQAVRSGAAPGFIDLGNGTSLRVSGRAAYEVGARTR